MRFDEILNYETIIKLDNRVAYLYEQLLMMCCSSRVISKSRRRLLASRHFRGS